MRRNSTPATAMPMMAFWGKVSGLPVDCVVVVEGVDSVVNLMDCVDNVVGGWSTIVDVVTIVASTTVVMVVMGGTVVMSCEVKNVSIVTTVKLTSVAVTLGCIIVLLVMAILVVVLMTLVVLVLVVLVTLVIGSMEGSMKVAQ